MKKINEHSLFCIFVFVLVCFIYYPVLNAQAVIDGDYNLVIAPLLKINSFTDYLHALQSNVIIDVQPVRDLSLILALKVSSIFKITKPIVYYNFLLWILCLYLIYKNFIKFHFPKWQATFITSLISVHPALTQTIPWMSAHKHILALFFTLITINVFLKFLNSSVQQNSKLVLGLIFYTLSIFAHPIYILIPLWFILLTLQLKTYSQWTKQLKILFGFMILIMLLGLVINYWYYSVPYIKSTQSYKFVSLGLSERFLALGRYFSQVTIPISFARNYYYGSTLNIVGLLLMPFFFLITKKILGTKTTILWSTLFLFPLVMVNIKSTNIFVSDTYLLLPIIGICALAFLTVEKLIKKIPIPTNYKITSFIILLLILSVKSRIEAKDWTDLLTFTKVAYEREKSCVNILNYSTHLWRIPKLRREATKVTQELVVRECQFQTYPSIFVYESRNSIIASIYFTKELTVNAKIRILKQSANPYAKLFLITLFLKNNQFADAKSLTTEVFGTNNYVFLSIENDPALNELDLFCQNNSSATCQMISSYLLKIKAKTNAQGRNGPAAPAALSRQNN